MNPYYKGPKSDHFDGERFFVPDVPFKSDVRRLLRWQLGHPKSKWPKAFPSPFVDSPPTRVKGLRVTLIGHASYLIQVADLNILVDPVYSERASPVTFAGPKRVNPPGIAFEKLPPIDLVLVTHGHYDHLDVATLRKLHQTHQPRILTPLGNDTVIRPYTDKNVEALDWGQSFNAGNAITIHLTPSYHWSARTLNDRLKTLWCNFVLTTPQGTLCHIGDTGYETGQIYRDVKQKFGPIALAHIPIGAYEPRWFMKSHHVNPEESVQIFKDLGAAHAIGHHWGTFQLTNEAVDDPEKHLREALANAAIDPSRFVAFRPGQVWTKGQSSQHQRF
jgi:L-ascorbate metabolism protein UlaG (beta-lactamase superfamily)